MPSTISILRPKRDNKSSSSSSSSDDNNETNSTTEFLQFLYKKKQKLDTVETDTDDNSRRELKPCHDDNDEKTSLSSDGDVTSSSSSSSSSIKVHPVSDAPPPTKKKTPQQKTYDSEKKASIEREEVKKSKASIEKEKTTVVGVKSAQQKIKKTIRFGDGNNNDTKKSKSCIRKEAEVAAVGVRSTQRTIKKSFRYGDDYVCDLNKSGEEGEKRTPAAKPDKVSSLSDLKRRKPIPKKNDNKKTTKKRKALEIFDMGSDKLLVDEFGKKKRGEKKETDKSVNKILLNGDNLKVIHKLRIEQIENHASCSKIKRKLKTTEDTSEISDENKKSIPTENDQKQAFKQNENIKQKTAEISPTTRNQKRKIKDLGLCNNRKVMHMDDKRRRIEVHKRAHKPNIHLSRSLKKLSKSLPLYPPLILPPVSYASLSLSNATIDIQENERLFESVLPWGECDLRMTHRFLQAKMVLGRDAGVKFCEDVLEGWKCLPDCESLRRHMAAMWCVYAHLLLQRGEIQMKKKVHGKPCTLKQAKEEKRKGWAIPKHAEELTLLLQGLTEAKGVLERAVRCPMASRLALVWIVKARMMEMEGVVRATLMRLECDGGTSVDWFEVLSRRNRRAREILNQGLDITPNEASVGVCAGGGYVRAQGISNIEERQLILKELHRLTDNFICASRTMTPPTNPLAATALLKHDSPLPTTTDQITPPPTSYTPLSSPVTPPPPDVDDPKSPTPISSPSPLFSSVEHLCQRCSRIVPAEGCPHCGRKFRGANNILRQNFKTKTSYKPKTNTRRKEPPLRKKALDVKRVQNCCYLDLKTKRKGTPPKILVLSQGHKIT